MRCLWVEPGSHHEGLLPTWVKVLGNLDVKMDVYLPRAALQRHVLRFTPHRHCRLHAYHGQLKTPGGFAYKNYDFMVLNSLEDFSGAEPRLYLPEIQDIPIPLLTVSHHADLLGIDPLLPTIQNHPQRKLLVTAPHVAEQLAQVDGINADIFFPMYYGDFAPLANGGHAVFSVQGTVDGNKRHYDSLMEAVEILKTEKLRNFKVQIVGRHGKGGDEVMRDIAKRGLRSHIVHPTLTGGYGRYYRALAQSHYLLPLIDETKPQYHRYFTYGSSSSIPLALGLGLVPVINRIQAEGWGIEQGSLLYEGADLTSAMRRAVSITHGELKYRQAQVQQARRFFLQQNALMLSLALRGAPLRFAA